MPKALAIDLASHQGFIACCDDGVAALAEVDHRIGDHELLPLLERTLAGASWDLRQIERIACVTGPGGFTSLRVAVTLANTLAAELGVPLAGVHASDLWRARSAERDLLWFHSTKKGALFARGFGSFADLWPVPSLLTVEECAAHCPEQASWCGELLPMHQEALQSRHLRQADRMPEESILPNMMKSLLYTSTPLEPWYGRGW